MRSYDIKILKKSSQVGPFVDSIIALADSNKKLLGFIPKDTFHDQSHRGRLWMAVHNASSELLGYLQYVRRMLIGEKSAEIPNRTVNLIPGSRLWIYSTLPKGCIEAVAQVNCVEVGTPSEIWNKYGDSLAVSESTYRRYVNGASSVSAIRIRRVSKLPKALTLSMLRMWVPVFHPPQFLKFMTEWDPLFLGINQLLCASTNSEYIEKIGLTKNATNLLSQSTDFARWPKCSHTGSVL